MAARRGPIVHRAIATTNPANTNYLRRNINYILIETKNFVYNLFFCVYPVITPGVIYIMDVILYMFICYCNKVAIVVSIKFTIYLVKDFLKVSCDLLTYCGLNWMRSGSTYL